MSKSVRETIPLPLLASSAIFVKEDKKAALLIMPQVLHNKRDFLESNYFCQSCEHYTGQQCTLSVQCPALWSFSWTMETEIWVGIWDCVKRWKSQFLVPYGRSLGLAKKCLKVSAWQSEERVRGRGVKCYVENRWGNFCKGASHVHIMGCSVGNVSVTFWNNIPLRNSIHL